MAYHGKYDSPKDLLLDQGLSRGEKIEMLEKWRDDEEALMRASDEGMKGNDRPALLKKINKTLRSLIEAAPEY